MRSLFALLSVAFLLSLSLISAGCLQDETAPPEGQYTSNETLVAFVEDAVAYVQENGKEGALEEFNNPEGLFIRENSTYTRMTSTAPPRPPGKPGEGRCQPPERDRGRGGGVPCGDERGHTKRGELPPDRVHQSPAQPDA